MKTIKIRKDNAKGYHIKNVVDVKAGDVEWTPEIDPLDEPAGPTDDDAGDQMDLAIEALTNEVDPNDIEDVVQLQPSKLRRRSR